MVTPTTVNVGLLVPLTGADVDVWGEDDVNPDFVAIDGLIGGVQSISLSNAPVTLSAPAGFTPTPGAGPTQSQNRVLRFTGTLSADVTVTLPIPCSYLVENFTTGAFDVILRGATAATEVIAIPQGDAVNIYNDGSRVRFIGLARMGQMEHWAGLSAMPSWVGKCTVRPYLICDDPATVYNVSDFPYLGARFLSKFGGNGINTFACPDMRGRVPLAYDSTGTRITTAGCGINGQTLGASADNQSITLGTTQIPAHQHSVYLKDPGHSHVLTGGWINTGAGGQGGSGAGIGTGLTNPATSTNTTGITIGSVNGVANDNQTANAGGGLAHGNVQPSIVTGIWVVKT